MNITRRELLALTASILLTGCGGGGGTNEDSWHTVVIEGVSFDVDKRLEVDVDNAKIGDGYAYYNITGDDAPYFITFYAEDKVREVTGTFNVADTNGVKVYWEADDDMPNIMFSDGIKSYGMSFTFPGKVDEAIVQHIAESVSL